MKAASHIVGRHFHHSRRVGCSYVHRSIHIKTSRPNLTCASVSHFGKLEQNRWNAVISRHRSLGLFKDFVRNNTNEANVGVRSTPEEVQQLTELLLDDQAKTPPGSLSIQCLENAEEAIEFWVSLRNPTGFKKALQILQRLVEEQDILVSQNEFQNSDSYTVRPFLVNRVVDCWRTGWKDGTLDITPTEISGILDGLESRGVFSDSRAYTMLIDGMISRGDTVETALFAQWLLDRRMELAEDHPALRPDAFLFTDVIRAWGRSGRLEAPEVAEGILELMEDLYESGWTKSAPDVMAYAATMQVWKKSEHPEAVYAIDKLLYKMKSSKREGLMPNTFIYTHVINSWAFSGTREGVEKCNEYLQEMITLFENGNDAAMPNVSNFSRVLLAFGQRGESIKAKEVFDKLVQLHGKTKNPELRPNTECLKALLIAYSKGGQPQEAQKILNDMIDSALKSGCHSQMPKRSYFIDVLVAWTKIHDRNSAAAQSDMLLRRMVKLASMGFPNLMPDSKAFLKVIRCWSRTRGKDSGWKAESLVHLAERLHHQSADPRLQPTASMVESIVVAWSRTNHREAPLKSERIIEDMEKKFESGQKHMEPSRGLYTNLMQTWLRSRRLEKHQKIQSIFDKIGILYSQGHLEYKPDLLLYSVLMESWAQRGDAARTQAIFEQMAGDYANGNCAAKPDIQAYNKILKAWSNSQNPNKGEKAEVALCRIPGFARSLGIDLEADEFSIGEMIILWSKSEAKDAANNAEKYLGVFKKNGYQLDFTLYRSLIECHINSKNRTSTRRASELLEELIDDTRANKVRLPFPGPYRRLLAKVASSALKGRSEQAVKLLDRLGKDEVHPLLFPKP